MTLPKDVTRTLREFKAALRKARRKYRAPPGRAVERDRLIEAACVMQAIYLVSHAGATAHKLPISDKLRLILAPPAPPSTFAIASMLLEELDP